MIKRQAILDGRAHNIHTRTTPKLGIRIADAAEAKHRELFGVRDKSVSVIGKSSRYELYKISQGRKQWMIKHPDDSTYFYSVDADFNSVYEGCLINTEILRHIVPFRDDIESFDLRGTLIAQP